jgi:disulfide bond formation protein DsbB
MSRPFRLSSRVVASFVAIALIAGVAAAVLPGVGIILGFVGWFVVVGTWFSVAIRTRQWSWLKFGTAPLTSIEGFVGFSGAILFGAGLILGVISGMSR